MITYLRGQVLAKKQEAIIVQVSGIGYEVFVNQNFYAQVKIGDSIEVYTHQYVREDTLSLYGFRNLEELELFELLLSISGVGPKSALGVLAIASPAEIKNSIAQGEVALLTKVSGIGRKTAERIVLELREKLADFNFTSSAQPTSMSVGGDEIDALVALGYSLAQARQALSQVDPKITSSSERIKQALKFLGK
jgi:Holliday junction DNA helicase RuvA